MRLLHLRLSFEYSDRTAHSHGCGCCTFACPSNIPIVQLIRTAKDDLTHRKEPDA